MQYRKVYLDTFAYELPSLVVSSRQLEERLKPVYDALRIPLGQLEVLTGIKERRWWPQGFRITDGAIRAAEKALALAGLRGEDLDLIIYAGVCRDYIEPATACAIGAALGVKSGTMIYDISNACLGVLNGIVDCANRIELGQIRTALVVSCESAREINEDTISKLLERRDMNFLKSSIASLTGGSGAAAVVLSDGSLASQGHQLLGGVHRSDVAHHELCRWGFKNLANGMFEQFMTTDAVGVLKHGVNLAVKTWQSLLRETGWGLEFVDKVISHQVGSAHRLSILKALGLGEEKDFPSYKLLGNIGTVSVPLTAALAEEHGFIKRGDQVGLLGIGSGLNCLMLGLKW